MRAMGVKRAAELRNVEAVPTFNDVAIQTIHSGSNTFNFWFGIVAESDIPVGDLSVGGESGIVVELLKYVRTVGGKVPAKPK